MKLLHIIAILALVQAGGMSQPVGGPKQLIFSRPQPVAEPTPRVADLIRQLANDSHATRQMAAQALLAMGPAIEPQLRWAMQREAPASEPFVKLQDGSYSSELDPKALLPRHALHELTVLISHLEEMRHRNASRITFRYKDQPLTNVLRELGRQLDADTSIGSMPYLATLQSIQTNRTTLELDQATFWEVVPTLGKRCGLAPSYNQVNELNWVTIPGLTTAPGSDKSLRSPPATVSGPFQIKTSSIELNRVADYTLGRNAATVTLTLIATAEPKLWYTGRHARVSLDQCVDDRGQSLIADGKRTFASLEGHSGWQWQVPLHLGAPRPRGRIKTLTGQLSVAATLNTAFLTLTNLLHAQGQFREYDGLRMTVAKVTADHESYQIAVELSAPAGSPYGATFSDADGWDVHVFDELRQPMRMGSLRGMWLSASIPFWQELRQEKKFTPPEIGARFGGVRQEAGRDVGRWTLIMARGKIPATLLWRTPEETRWITVPFELRDIPVPW